MAIFDRLRRNGGGSLRGALPDVLEGSRGSGFPRDFTLRIVEQETTPSGWRRFVGKGLYQGHEVGLRAALGAKWEPLDLKGGVGAVIRVHRGRAELQSIGDASALLLGAMSIEYGCGAVMSPFADRVPFAALFLEGDPARLDTTLARIKMAHESEASAGVAHFFLGVDVRSGRLTIGEKEADSRRPLLTALSGGEGLWSQPGLQNPTNIDMITGSSELRELRLVMFEARPWVGNPNAISELKAKLTAYVQFLESGELRKEQPQMADYQQCIELTCIEQPPPEIAAFIQKAHPSLAKRGIDFRVTVKPLGV